MEESFDISELKKIKEATSGFFKKKARQKVAVALKEMDKEVKNIYKLYPFKNLKPTEDHKKKFWQLKLKYHDKRHVALRMGANSHSHPEWAAASACESWAMILSHGNPEEQKYARNLVQELIQAGS